jgi:hypothetical protein
MKATSSKPQVNAPGPGRPSQLPPDEQSDLIEVVRRRLIELRRQEIVAYVREADAELAEGRPKATTAANVLREIQP